MSVRDLIPWRRNTSNPVPTFYREDERDPLLSLHREVNRLFDDVFRSFDGRLPTFGSTSSLAGTWPSVEISDTDKEIKVSAEVPGLDQKDIEVVLDAGVLTLKGEKRSETRGEQFSERFYGRFERRIPLGADIEEDKIEARFKNGVLDVVLPKSAKAQSQVKRIAIKS